MSVARAVWFERPGVASVRTGRLQQPGAGEVAVRTLFCGISAGTERIVLRGEVPPAIHAAMRLPSMAGNFELPVSYGYAAVGVVDVLGSGVSPSRLGQRVFALHPHHDRFVAHDDELRPLPDGVPAERLVLAANLETAVNVVWDAGIGLGERVVVVGLGVVGLLVTRLAARAGASSVTGIDPVRERRELALRLGATDAVPATDMVRLAEEDVLIDASGSPAALAALVGGAGSEARVVVASWYGAREVALPLGGSFHPHRVTIRSSQVGAIPTSRRGRWTLPRRWRLVCDLLADPALDALIATPLPFSDAPRVYEELAAGVLWHPPQRVLDAGA